LNAFQHKPTELHVRISLAQKASIALPCTDSTGKRGNRTSAMTWRMPRRWAIIRAVIQLSPVIM